MKGIRPGSNIDIDRCRKQARPGTIQVRNRIMKRRYLRVHSVTLRGKARK
ncbi:MAG: hypothetical protein IPP88_19435 [Betaproteobacteria bacterium]|nr:hypothetical protein [Betaproteobacteria bacterium]